MNEPITLSLDIAWRDVRPEVFAIMVGVSEDEAREAVESHIIRGEN